jgi:hypothetical protein
VAILLTSSAFDTYLYLIGPSGSVVAQDDDGGGGSNSRIPPRCGHYTLPSSGTYTIEVTSFYRNSTGSYTLSLGGPVACTPPSSQPCPPEYPYQSPRLVGTGIAAGRDFGWFCYRRKADANRSIEVGKWQYRRWGTDQDITLKEEITPYSRPFVSITLTREQQDILGVSRPSIQVHENAADLFQQALSRLPQAQSQYQRNSRIPPRSDYYTLPSTGTYIIEVTSYSENATGSYTLSLSAAGAPTPSPPPTPTPSPPGGCTTTAISIGQTVRGALTTSDGRSPIKGKGRSYYCDRYTFSGTAGQQVAIQLTSSAFDTSLYLIGPSGRVLTYDNDYAGRRLILSYGGTVALRLMRTSNEVSYHSWGIAIDINSAECPQPSDPDCAGGRNRFLYENVFRNWTWGGNWPPRYRDPMHFELPVERRE